MPIRTVNSYESLPAWLQEYAKEAAQAAYDATFQPGVEGGAPTLKPYRRYEGERFAPVNEMETAAQTRAAEQNPLIDASAGIKRLLENSARMGISENVDPYMRAFNENVLAPSVRGANFPNLMTEAGNQFSRPGGHGRPDRTFQELAALESNRAAQDANYLAAQLAVRGYEGSRQAYQQDMARLLELAHADMDSNNLLALERQQDINSLLNAGAYLRSLEERPMRAAEEEFRRAERHPYESLRFLISALGGIPADSSTTRSDDRPDAPGPSRSMRSSDFAGMAAQAAPILLGEHQRRARERDSR